MREREVRSLSKTLIHIEYHTHTYITNFNTLMAEIDAKQRNAAAAANNSNLKRCILSYVPSSNGGQQIIALPIDQVLKTRFDSVSKTHVLTIPVQSGGATGTSMATVTAGGPTSSRPAKITQPTNTMFIAGLHQATTAKPGKPMPILVNGQLQTVSTLPTTSIMIAPNLIATSIATGGNPIPTATTLSTQLTQTGGNTLQQSLVSLTPILPAAITSGQGKLSIINSLNLRFTVYNRYQIV